MRYAYLVLAFVTVLTVGIFGFRGALTTRPPLEVFPDMDRQAKYKPQAASAFFADGRADRPLPAGVVAANYGPLGRALSTDDHFTTGKKADGSFARGFPAEVEINAQLLARGRDRYAVYCAPCHGALGDGNGITKSYGMGSTPTYHDDAKRGLADGDIFNTITHGKATMMSYADKLSVEERWAVVAYVRALQRAHVGKVADVPPSHRKELGLE